MRTYNPATRYGAWVGDEHQVAYTAHRVSQIIGKLTCEHTEEWVDVALFLPFTPGCSWVESRDISPSAALLSRWRLNKAFGAWLLKWLYLADPP